MACGTLLGVDDLRGGGAGSTSTGGGQGGDGGSDGGGGVTMTGGTGGEGGCLEAADCQAMPGGACRCNRCAYPDAVCPGTLLRYHEDAECVPAPMQIDLYYQHACVRRSDGTVWCWGWNCSGQLGNQSGGVPCHNDDVVLSAAPVQVQREGAPLDGVVEVATGIFHTCARRDDGTVWCWGGNLSGQIGNGQQGMDLVQPEPVQVVGAKDSEPLPPIVDIASGGQHTCALDHDGRLWCWGLDNYGQIGAVDGQADFRPRPVQVDAAFRFDRLAGGGEHTCARAKDMNGQLYCWGRNNLGQLGAGTDTFNETPTPQLVVTDGAQSPLARVTAVGAGNRFTCASTYSPSQLWCWGQNARHALGDGSQPDKADGATQWFAVPVAYPPGTDAVRVDGGDSFACALLQTHQLVCWGDNSRGQLGDKLVPCPTCWSAPAIVREDVRDFAAGFVSTCAIVDGGRVLCWGDNDKGQLGNGTRTQSHQAVEVAPMCP